MALTARERILLPKEEQERRKGELSAEECLRIELDYIHFTEEEKVSMSQEKVVKTEFNGVLKIRKVQSWQYQQT